MHRSLAVLATGLALAACGPTRTTPTQAPDDPPRTRPIATPAPHKGADPLPDIVFMRQRRCHERVADTRFGVVHVRAGAVSTRAVESLVRAHRAELDACYARARASLPRDDRGERIDLGEVVVRVRVDSKGRVDDAQIEQGTTAESAAAACVVDALRAWTFPAATRRAQMTLLLHGSSSCRWNDDGHVLDVARR